MGFRLIFLILSMLFLVYGTIGFIIFLMLTYYAAAVWSLATGVVAGLAAHINSLLFNKKLSNWYGLEEFDYINRLTFGFIAVTISGFVYHLVYYGLSVYHNYTHNAAVVQACIQSAISGIWSVTLMLLADKTYEELIFRNYFVLNLIH